MTDYNELWCPMVRYVPARSFSFGRIVAAVNRWLDKDDRNHNPDPAQCIGPKCAMWRVHGTKADLAFRGKEPVGFCGLAGHPEYLP